MRIWLIKKIRHICIFTFSVEACLAPQMTQCEVLTNTHKFCFTQIKKKKWWDLVFSCVCALDGCVNMCVPPAWSALSSPLSWSKPPRGTGSAASGTGSDPGGWNALLTGSWDRIGRVSVRDLVQTEENRHRRLIPSLHARSALPAEDLPQKKIPLNECQLSHAVMRRL